MKTDNILILGSTFLTELVINELKRNQFNIIGYVPNKIRSTVSGNIDLDEKDLKWEYELGDAKAIRAILSPFVGNTFDPRNIGRGGEQGYQDYR